MKGADTDGKLRVSVATYNQVVFPHPQNGTVMLALERKATISKDGGVNVRSQPFGGGVRIENPDALREMLGEIQFDSQRSKEERDFRILIPPEKWNVVKKYCMEHLRRPDDSQIESTPDRELIEEFEETLGVDLKPNQYEVGPLGFVVESQPVWTENWYARGYPTVRIYRTYKVQIIDGALCEYMLTATRQYSDQGFGVLALTDQQNGGRGRANSVLTLRLNTVRESYLALSPERRYRKIVVESHELDESVLAVLEDVDVPQYHRF